MSDHDQFSQDLTRYRQLLKGATGRFQAARADMEALQRIVDGLEVIQARRLVERTFSDPAEVPTITFTPADAVPAKGDTGIAVLTLTPSSGPRGVEAVRRVMGESPDRNWAMAEIFDALQARGWASDTSSNPKAAARAAVQRLIKLGEAELVGRATFRLTTSPNGEAPANTGATIDQEIRTEA
jgi:hypothetical protein